MKRSQGRWVGKYDGEEAGIVPGSRDTIHPWATCSNANKTKKATTKYMVGFFYRNSSRC